MMANAAGHVLFAEAMQLYRLVFSDERGPLTKLHRALGVLRAGILFRKAETGVRVNASGYVRVVAEGRIRLGDQVQFFGGMIPSRVVCQDGGELSIDSLSGFNYGVSIECTRMISIGKRCMFGSMSSVRDATKDKTAPVFIEDDVWVAHGAMIEPGVRIGAGSVVAAGSVVMTDVPPRSLALGNPAKSVGMDLVRAGARGRA
jgi:acetyltransferase-like isoleucine patch superfamily enzyme